MFKDIIHQYSKYANQTLSWLPMDTEKRYLDNLNKNYDLLKKYNWIGTDISYKFNSYGFRSDEFSHDPGIVFLGCSYTVGVGLPVESTWSHIVSTKLNLKRYNLGIGGASNDTAFRLGHHWIPQLQPKLVIFLSTEPTRTELHTASMVENIGVDEDVYTNSAYYKEWITNQANVDMNYEKNLLAIKQICSEHNIKFRHEKFSNIKKTAQLARDLAHPGIESNKLIAGYFLSKL
jgi:hypothetical protein